MIAEDLMEKVGMNLPEEPDSIFVNVLQIKYAMIEFAKYHVEQAIEKIVDDNPGNMNKADIQYLLKSYPLENIK